jgi:dsRNA-specific ribonuclease
MKKLKLTDELQNTLLPNYSHAFTRMFPQDQGLFVTHFYRLQGFTRIAVLLPLELAPCPSHLVEGHCVVKLSPDHLEQLKVFQAVLWSDLFKVLRVQGGESETCNYLVVPTQNGAIDHELVRTALRSPPEAPVEVGRYVHTKHSRKILWEVLKIVDSSTQSQDFLVALLGLKHPSLEAACSKYALSTVFDILFDDSWTLDALAGFRNLLIKDKLETVSSRSKVLVVKQVASVRSNKKSKVKGYHLHGTPVLPIDSVELSYLDTELVSQSFSLPQVLIDLESFSYVCDFCREFDFQGPYQLIYSALRSPSLDAKDNYDSLETLGDAILKFLVSFYLFLDRKQDNEGQLSYKRRRLVSNWYLAEVGYAQGLQYYLKAQPCKMNRWKPPYFASPELVFVDRVLHKLSSGMLADAVEAIIGAFYVSKGLLHAIDFIERISLVKGNWDKVRAYCDSQSFNLLTAAKLPLWAEVSKASLDDLIPKPTCLLPTGSFYDRGTELLEAFHYEPKDYGVFDQAFTHRTANYRFNYERLEYLGDALLDLIVMSNVYASSEEMLPPHTLTLIHHALVNNNALAFFSISLSLHSYMKADCETSAWLDCFLAKMRWDDDLLNFGVHSQDPPKPFADLFEAFVASLLIDCESVSLACRYIQLVMARPMAYLSLNKAQCQSNIVSRVRELVQKQGQALTFPSQTDGDLITVAVVINGKEICKNTATTRWLAERCAANQAYHLLSKAG